MLSWNLSSWFIGEEQWGRMGSLSCFTRHNFSRKWQRAHTSSLVTVHATGRGIECSHTNSDNWASGHFSEMGKQETVGSSIYDICQHSRRGRLHAVFPFQRWAFIISSSVLMRVPINLPSIKTSRIHIGGSSNWTPVSNYEAGELRERGQRPKDLSIEMSVAQWFVSVSVRSAYSIQVEEFEKEIERAPKWCCLFCLSTCMR